MLFSGNYKFIRRMLLVVTSASMISNLYYCGEKKNEYIKIDSLNETYAGADAVIENFSVEGIGAAGKSYRLNAKQAYLFYGEKKVKIVDLKIEYFQGKKIDSTMTAGFGEIDNANQKITAEKNIIWISSNGRKLTTEKLFYLQQTSQLGSDSPSRIFFPEGDVIGGSGFRADQKLERYQLFQPQGIKNLEGP